MRFSLSWCVGEIAMNHWSGCRQPGKRNRPENEGTEHHKHYLLHRPKRGDIVSVKQVLRGKIPGNPG